MCFRPHLPRPKTCPSHTHPPLKEQKICSKHLNFPSFNSFILRNSKNTSFTIFQFTSKIQQPLKSIFSKQLIQKFLSTTEPSFCIALISLKNMDYVKSNNKPLKHILRQSYLPFFPTFTKPFRQLQITRPVFNCTPQCAFLPQPPLFTRHLSTITLHNYRTRIIHTLHTSTINFSILPHIKIATATSTN